MNSIVWYDYETFGASPAWDRPAQFAAIRTDEDLNEIEPPVELFCRQADDYLPHPQAVAITGITPQQCNQRGIAESEFIAGINQMLSQPGSCSAGYNSIRFDDEVTRYTLYRNFLDPYAREWQGGNSRWDLLDAMRCAYALRPDGIVWPKHDDGRPSFKLEHLTIANDLDHGKAHDAVSDVRATIALARLLKDKQPKLYRYLYDLRHKSEVAALVDVHQHRPLVHISGMYPAERGCMAIVAPLCWHPTNKNSFIAVDLSQDPTPLFDLTAEQIAERVFTRQADLPEGVERLALKEVHINKAPVLAPAKTLTPDRAQHWQIDGETLRQNLASIQQYEQQHGNLSQKLHQVYGRREFAASSDVDGRLYDGFFSRNDKQAMEDLHRLSGWDLVDWPSPFADERGEEMLFRYRARNYPETLEGDERQRWEAFRRQRLLHGIEGSPVLTFERFAIELQQLAQQLMEAGDEKRLMWLQELQFYAESLYPMDD